MIYLTKDNYSQYRKTIQSGDLIAWRGESLVGRFIRAWTQSEWSHVGVAWVVGGRVFILEAREFRGVGMRPLSSALPADLFVTHQEWTEESEQYALAQMNKPYSYLDAFRAGLGLKMQSMGLQCAEYARHVLNKMHLPIPDTVNTPAGLVRWIHTGGSHANDAG